MSHFTDEQVREILARVNTPYEPCSPNCMRELWKTSPGHEAECTCGAADRNEQRNGTPWETLMLCEDLLQARSLWHQLAAAAEEGA